MARHILFLSFLMFTLSSCGSSSSVNEVFKFSQSASSDPVTREVSVGRFSELSVAMGVTVEYTCVDNGSSKVTVTAPSDCIDYLKVKTEDGTLCIYYDFGTFRSGFNQPNTSSTVVKVEGPALQGIEASSSASVVLRSDMVVDDEFDIDLSSSASLTWEGLVSVDGKADIELSSVSQLQMGSLRCNQADFDLSSSSSVAWSGALMVSGNADVDLSSAAELQGGSMACKNIVFDLSSASKCIVKTLICNDLSGSASSQASLTLSGKCHNAVLDASSTAVINASGMRAEAVTADASSVAVIYAPSAQRLTYSHDSQGKVSWTDCTQVREDD